MRVEMQYRWMEPHEFISIRENFQERAGDIHCHEFIELDYILSGEGYQVINGECRLTRTGDMVLFGLGDWHMLIPKGRMTLCNCLINPDYFIQRIGKEWLTCGDADGIRFRNCKAAAFQGELKEEVERLLQCMLWEYRNRTEQYADMITGLLRTLLIHYRNARKSEMSCGQRHLGEELKPADSAEDLIRIVPKLFQYIDANFQKHVGLKDVARVGYYNPTYFSSYFKKNFGRTLTDFIHFKRYLTALDYMVNTNLSIDEIACEVGYSDKKLFYKVIRQFSGMLPSRCRELFRNKYKSFAPFSLEDEGPGHQPSAGA